MSRDNLSAVLYGKNDMRLEQRPIPVPGKNEVVLKMGCVGICGSDVHYLTTGRCATFVVVEPMVLGHEAAGVVVQCGEGVKHLTPGDRVAIEPGIPCRTCEHCKKGSYNLCPDIEFCATPPVDGNLCRYYKHAADFCFKLGENVSLEEGAMLEPLSVAVHACRRAGVSAGHKVLVCGAGPIGLLNLMTAKAVGASSVCITDISERRLELARAVGADHTINVTNFKPGEVKDKVTELFGGYADITIECTGVESSVEYGILATKSGGTFLQVGMGSVYMNLPFMDASIREIDIRGVFRYANCYAIALDLVNTGKVNVKPLITHRYTLEESHKAYETSRTGADGAVKVMIKCSDDI